MENKQPSQMDLLIESHLGLARQGPGSAEMTMKALSFVQLPDGDSRIADLGCGTGGQTMLLGQNIRGSIVGVDMMPEFIGIFNNQARGLGLQDKVQGIVGSIDALSFEKESLDLIWSEGVIDSLGFEKMLAYWQGFLKRGGYVSLTCPTWLSDERPSEVQKFWSDAGSGMDSIESNIVTLRKCGYQLAAVFVLPELCWDNYFTPRKAAEAQLLEKYPGNALVEEYVRSMAYEVELYERFKHTYGYVFYIGRKI